MKTLENEKGLDLKPCLNCIPTERAIAIDPWPLGWGSVEFLKICPCSNHSGEILRQNNIITIFSCENRKMHTQPKFKNKALPSAKKDGEAKDAPST